jgi:2-haloacid dehalogenase
MATLFSNGTPTQLQTSIHQSPGLKDSVFATSSALPFASVHDVKRFKPAPEAYTHLLSRLGVDRGEASSVAVVSANPFDIVGAAEIGLRTVWVDREGKGWTDGLGKPEKVVRGLGDVVEWIRKA